VLREKKCQRDDELELLCPVCVVADKHAHTHTHTHTLRRMKNTRVYMLHVCVYM